MTILIVDDNLKNQKLFLLLLRSCDHQLLVANNGAEGVEVTLREKPDLILMDIQMPVMDGIQALKKLKGDPSTEHIPVIALTSYAMKGDRERFLAEGFDAYVSKPVEHQSFLETVNAFLSP